MADNLSDAPLAPGGLVPTVTGEALAAGTEASPPVAAPASTGAEATIPPAPPKPSFVGIIDKLAYGRLSGWAVTMEGNPCDVIVQLNGNDIANVTSDQPRPDLAAKQLSRGLGGWHFDLGTMLVPGDNVIDVKFTDGTSLRNGPFTFDPNAGEQVAAAAPADVNAPKTYVGAIDTPQADVIAGWSIGSDFKAAAVVVTVNDGPSVLIQADADRPDLIAQHLTKSGGGWHFDVKPMLVQGLNVINVNYPDGKHLPGSPIERQNGENPPGFVKAEPVREPAPVAATPEPATPTPEPATPPPSPPATAQLPPQTVQVAMSAFTKKPVVTDPQAEAQAASNITPFPGRTSLKPGMPTLSELDEVSLDDISLAIAAGMINVGPAAVHEPVPDPEPTEVEIQHIHEIETKRRGFFARLLGRG